VFISYASQDAEAVTQICGALRSGGIEVWLDQSELRGGDAWDRQIRERIHDCRLFIAVISASTETRDEGYFRREWKLAADRTHDMAEKKPFLLPVVIDATPERGASVPDKFHEVQWTRLPAGTTPAEFVERVRRLLSPDPVPAAVTAPPVNIPSVAATGTRDPGYATWRSKVAPIGMLAVVVVGLGYLVSDRLVRSPHPAATAAPASGPAAQAAAPATAGFHPPPHSIAVLPFLNMSGDKEQEYFSDGLTEELLNSLSRINALQVAARTSAFSFKGKDTDITTIAHQLNVGAVLEGSVRRSGHTIRVTAQLINAVTGFHLWSDTYDRDLGDVLKLQTEIATAVASALKVTLLGNEAAQIELGGTQNPAALDVYLRTTKMFWSGYSPKVCETAVAGYTDAIRLDPNYALAYAARALAWGAWATLWTTTPAGVRARLEQGQADAARAIALAPNLSEGYLARAVAHSERLEIKQAEEDYARALALGSGNARVLRDYGTFAIHLGHGDSGLAAVRHSVELDPLNSSALGMLGESFTALRRYPEALTAYNAAEALPSDTPGANLPAIGMAHYLLGDFDSARASCERDRKQYFSSYCLAMTYDKLGRHADAKAELQKYRAVLGDTGHFNYAEIYAQWGDLPKALESLESALRWRDSGLLGMKTDPLLDPLRQEPRFQAIERELQFPN
jgi:TolB-like protein/tetratricopeptide (TPR) repeat protein